MSDKEDGFDFLRNKNSDHKKNIDYANATISKDVYISLVTFIEHVKAKRILNFDNGVSAFAFIDGGCDDVLILNSDKSLDVNQFKGYSQIAVKNFTNNTLDILGPMKLKDSFDIGFVNLKKAAATYADLNLSISALSLCSMVIIHGLNKNVITSHLYVLQHMAPIHVDASQHNGTLCIITKMNDEFTGMSSFSM